MTEIRTTSKAVLLRMLRRLDDQLAEWDYAKHTARLGRYAGCKAWLSKQKVLDARRREVRRKLKERR
jgi:hypothetical protein